MRPSVTDWENGPQKVIISFLGGATSSSYKFEDMYRTVYQLVLYGMGDFVYTDIIRLFTEHLDIFTITKLAPFITSSESDLEGFVAAIVAEWKIYTSAVDKTRQMCKYLDKIYCASSFSAEATGPPPLLQASHEVFISRVFLTSDYPIKQTVQTYLASRPLLGEHSGTARNALADILLELRKSDKAGRIEEAFPEQQ